MPRAHVQQRYRATRPDPAGAARGDPEPQLPADEAVVYCSLGCRAAMAVIGERICDLFGWLELFCGMCCESAVTGCHVNYLEVGVIYVLIKVKVE